MDAQPAFSRYRIERIDSLLPDVRSFRFVPLEGAPLERNAGQYVTVRFRDKERPYSLSGPTNAPYLEITVRLAGEFTHLLFEAKEGEEVLVSGPQGRFSIDRAKVGSSEIVLVAGGVGITPLVSILEHLGRTGFGNAITLMYASRSPSEIIFKERLESLADANKNLRIVYSVDSVREGESWEGHRGFMTREHFERNIPSPAEKKYFICGPPPMVKAIVGILKELSVPLTNVTLEGW